jgi:hypothetical protein
MGSSAVRELISTRRACRVLANGRVHQWDLACMHRPNAISPTTTAASTSLCENVQYMLSPCVFAVIATVGHTISCVLRSSFEARRTHTGIVQEA